MDPVNLFPEWDLCVRTDPVYSYQPHPDMEGWWMPETKWMHTWIGHRARDNCWVVIVTDAYQVGADEFINQISHYAGR